MVVSNKKDLFTSCSVMDGINSREKVDLVVNLIYNIWPYLLNIGCVYLSIHN